MNTEFFLLPLYLRLDNLTPGMLRIECQELGKIPAMYPVGMETRKSENKVAPFAKYSK